MTHADVTECVQHALVRNNSVGAREHIARLVKLGGHGNPPYRPWLTGFQPAGANSNPSNEKPGATVQPVSVQSPRLSAACQARAGTATCGTSPAWMSAPSLKISSLDPSTISSLSGAPP